MPKFTRRPTARPDEILDAALERFVAVGFAQARMEEIAEGAGVTAGTIYRYFENKEALVEALLVRHIDASWSRGREISEAYATMTAREIVELLLHRWADHLDQPTSSALLVLIVREAGPFPGIVQKYVSQLLEPGCLSIERAIRHGIEQGEFPLIEIEGTARALAATVVERAIWRHTFTPFLPALPAGVDPARLAIESLVRGLPRPGDTRSIRPDTPFRQPDATVSTTGTGRGRLRVVTLTPPQANP
ncbi:MAG TPA: TetR/AcrR family transcriptional regulator [Gemmatimonadales bacterium]|nr:TetR/AcrR family transcriptional regulator [Gemmatimonadales bacterium]